MELKKGYKQTEIGAIPVDWEASELGNLVKLKNGYSLSSRYFSEKGPIVITPGNFKLTGGLRFNQRNTLRYSGDVNENMKFKNGDLLIVMTDLTPSCNLLGKSGIVNSTETILHNQRIGKISISSKSLHKKYLYWFFVSDLFSNRMKATATGSTVRHTSVGSINNSLIPLPPLPEQKAIAQVLSDTDQLIQAIQQKIAKKRAIKQGAMQELLAPKDGWVVKSILELVKGNAGIKIGPFGSALKKELLVDSGYKVYGQENVFEKSVNVGGRFITHQHFNKLKSCELKPNDFIVSMMGTVGKCMIMPNDMEEGIMDSHLLRLRLDFKKIEIYYLVHFFSTMAFLNQVSKYSVGGIMDGLSSKIIKRIEIPLPINLKEQTRIATILSDMDNELAQLEEKHNKYQQLKQGLMQNLLTGKIRLL